MSNTTHQPPKKPNPGWFKKGHDPRRHTFTTEDCSKGFWAALESVAIRYPNEVYPDGGHMVCNFLAAVKTRRALRGTGTGQGSQPDKGGDAMFWLEMVQWQRYLLSVNR